MIAWCGDGRALHKTHGVCTGVLCGGVEEVGKQGQVRGEEDRFSNSPETHRRDLENWAGTHLHRDEGDGEGFHFSSVNYGYYCSFNYLNVLFRGYPSQRNDRG